MGMQRREFLGCMAGLAAASVSTAGESAREDTLAKWRESLSSHRIADAKSGATRVRWPRQVGKNSRKDVHGNSSGVHVCRLFTDQGATGWGSVRGGSAAVAKFIELYKGKSLGEIFDPAVGVTGAETAGLDFALHDLAGVILDIPVYKMLGASGPDATDCYSGMIYFDDLEPPDKPAGIDQVLANCQYDIDIGYRQLKVKIGRGNKWMEKQAGLARDIEVTREIAGAFPEIEIMVDGNDGFTADELIFYLEGIGDVPLFFIEEPFRENVEDYAKIREWHRANRRQTYLADGEGSFDVDAIQALMEKKLLDIHQTDIQSYGFTAWRKLMPEIQRLGVLASPHTFGNQLKSVYTAHLAAGLGNVITIEGVTCESDEIDFGPYVKNGQFAPSSKPGFGMSQDVV